MALDRPSGAPDRARLDLAVAAGVDVLEVDVAACAGGTLVLLHDLRLPDGSAVERLDLAGLRRRVPRLLTLDEALEHLAGRLPLLLDLKGDCAAPLGARLAAVADADGLAVCTDDVAALLQLRYTAPRVARWRSLPAVGEGPGSRRRRITAAARRATLVRDLGFLAGEVAAAGVCVDHWAVTPALGRECARLRLAFDAWTVNDLRRARRMAACGADLITSDVVATLRPLLGVGRALITPGHGW